jgi:site-specific recombinase XerD
VAADGFAAHLEAFLAELRVRRFSTEYMTRLSNFLPRFFAFLADIGIHDPRDVQEAHLVAFARSLERATTRFHGTPLAPVTRSNYLRAVRRFFASLEEQGALLRDPAAELPVPRPCHLPRMVLTARQAARLMNTPSPWTTIGRRDQALLEVLYGCGLRRGECSRLDVSDADLQRGALLVSNGKGKRDRLTPLAGRAAKALDSYLEESRPEILKDPQEKALFLSCATATRGRRLSCSGLSRVVSRHAKAAGLPHVHPHALRHTCATHVLRGGADLKHVQELLGHKSIASTTIYTRVNLSDLLAVIDRCHPRERRRR